MSEWTNPIRSNEPINQPDQRTTPSKRVQEESPRPSFSWSCSPAFMCWPLYPIQSLRFTTRLTTIAPTWQVVIDDSSLETHHITDHCQTARLRGGGEAICLSIKPKITLRFIWSIVVFVSIELGFHKLHMATCKLESKCECNSVTKTITISNFNETSNRTNESTINKPSNLTSNRHQHGPTW